ncbi:MAG: PAS domain S-box protein, partial [Epsilonproteobacteria bacterium]|nr:PAS domain S-box protein [Campylobacterota bacterium]
MSLEYTLGEFFVFGLFTFGGIGFCVWKRRQERLSRFIDLTIDGIVLSSNGVIVEVNQQAISIFGSFSKYQLLGKNVLDFVAPQSKELVKEKLAMSRVDRYECTLLKSDGTPFPALIRGTNIGHKKHLRLSAIVDLSELKKTTQALEVLNQTLAQKVEEHIAKNRQQEMVLFQQARHAQMGEMISMIAHQWR